MWWFGWYPNLRRLFSGLPEPSTSPAGSPGSRFLVGSPGSRFGDPEHERLAFTDAYGYDIAGWPAYQTLLWPSSTAERLTTQ